MARGQRRKGQKRDVKGLWSGDRSCQGPHDPAARQLPSRQGFAPAPASPGGGGRRLPAGFGGYRLPAAGADHPPPAHAAAPPALVVGARGRRSAGALQPGRAGGRRRLRSQKLGANHRLRPASAPAAPSAHPAGSADPPPHTHPPSHPRRFPAPGAAGSGGGRRRRRAPGCSAGPGGGRARRRRRGAEPGGRRGGPAPREEAARQGSGRRHAAVAPGPGVAAAAVSDRR